MSDSSARKLKTVVEAAGAGAVLLGLIFVGLEVKQNTAAMQAATIQGLADSSQEHLLLLASDPELLEIQQKAVTDPDQLSETEARQYFLIERARWLRSHVAFQQFRRGTLGDEDWQPYERLLCRRKLSSWQEHKSLFSNRFVEFVESTCNWQDITP
jgi:hypothetical protein